MTPLDLIPGLTDVLGKVIDRVWPDPVKAAEAKQQILAELSKIDAAQIEGASTIIAAEAQGESWLQRNWRPGLMVVFACLILTAWFGWVPANMPANTIDRLFDLLTVGIGGYIGGRSIEKVARTVMKR